MKTLGAATVAAGAGGAMASLSTASAQTPARRAQRLSFGRLPLSNGFILHAGETSMELYHRHPHDPKEEIVQPEDIRLQTRLTLRNHKEILDWMGLGWKNVVKLTLYPKRMDELPQIEQVLESYFRDELPPMAVYEINGLSSPQARLEIDLWVVPPPGTPEANAPAPVRGIASIFPRPEVTGRVAYAPGIKVPRDMDLIFFSGLTAYPWDVDPWSPGAFKVPADPAERSRLATANVEGVLKAAGVGFQHIINNVNYTAPGGGPVNFREHWGDYSPCSTSLRVTDTGIPGTNVLYQLNAVAPRKTIAAARGVVAGIEPILPRPGMVLRDLPAAPAIRVSSDVDLVFFSSVTANDEQGLASGVERALKGAGLAWNNVVLMTLVGQGVTGATLRAPLGDWRPCRTIRAVSTGLPGAAMQCEITAVAPRQRGTRATN